MNKFEAIEVINLHGGHVELDEDQARRRVHNIKEVKKGVYEIVNPIQFKVGEKFGYDGEVNKRLAQSLEDVVNAAKEAVADTGEDESDIVYPNHLGGPWYELSNGEKVQGKKDAEDAELALSE